jgi:release factor glutamine methyltransferase
VDAKAYKHVSPCKQKQPSGMRMSEPVLTRQGEDINAIAVLSRLLQSSGHQFTTGTPATHQRVLAREASRLANDLLDVFGWSRSFRLETLPRQVSELLQASGFLEQVGEDLWRSGLRFSSLGTLLMAHSAYPTREPDAVFFGPDTYRFCRLLTDWAPTVHSALDIGCGSGAGGLWLKQLGRCQTLLLSDINEKALRLATANAQAAHQQVETIISDLYAAIPVLPDLCIANPPYMLDTEHRAYRDGGGTHGEGLSIRIVREWLERAQPGQCLILYTGSAIIDNRDLIKAQTQALSHLHKVTAWQYEELDPDVFGEELELPHCQHIERIAAVGMRITR